MLARGGRVRGYPRRNDRRLGIRVQVIQGYDNVPAVQLALVDRLRALIKARGVAQTDRIGGRKQAEVGVRMNHPALVQQRELALRFENPVDDEHDVGTAGVVFIENQGDRALQRPGNDSFAKFRDLFAVDDGNRVLADQIETAHVAVEIDAHAGPVQPRRNLFHVGRLAGTVIALYQYPPVVHEPGQQRQGRIRVEAVGGNRDRVRVRPAG